MKTQVKNVYEATNEELAAQEQIEIDAVDAGVRAYLRARQTRSEAELPPGQRIIYSTIEPLAKAIAVWSKKVHRGNAAAHGRAARLLADLDPLVIASLVARSCVNAIGGTEPPKLTALATSIGSLLLDEINLASFAADYRELYTRVDRSLTRCTSYRHRHNTLGHVMSGVDTERTSFAAEDKASVGLAMVGLFRDTTGLIEIGEVWKHHKRVAVVLPTEQADTLLEMGHKRCSLLHPMYQPMIVPPRDWTTVDNGGYLTLQLGLVKTRERLHMQALRQTEMPIVYQAINSLQRIPWQINRRVYEVMFELFSTNSPLAGLPTPNNLALPPKPADMDTNPEAAKQWRQDATQIHNDRVVLSSQRRMLDRQIGLAGKFADYERIWFPYQLDWRGRVYPVPTGLSPQGDDHGKALLQFATSHKITPEAEYWMCVHLANVCGNDKIGFDERVAWVQKECRAEIIDSATNPLDGRRWWAGQDSPFQCLAMCFELADYWEGVSDETRIPVALDATCSGIQHFSALLLDPIGGRYTNLVPQDKPGDIYRAVAEVVNQLIEEDIQADVATAYQWRGHVNRSICKPNVMTLPYAATLDGMTQQLCALLNDMRLHGSLPSTLTDVYNDYSKPCRYLAGLNIAACRQVVRACFDVRDVLQSWACTLADNDLPCWWTSPSGFLACQLYRKVTSVKVESRALGKRMSLTLKNETDEINKRGCKQGASPNVVHSCDAALMHRTICRLAEVGIEDFAAIHDSFGVHADCIPTLNRVAREEFVAIYERDVLADICAELQAQLPADVELVGPPERGALDIHRVLESSFFIH